VYEALFLVIIELSVLVPGCIASNLIGSHREHVTTTWLNELLSYWSLKKDALLAPPGGLDRNTAASMTYIMFESFISRGHLTNLLASLKLKQQLIT